MDGTTFEFEGILCRLWESKDPEGCIVMVHGLQSHAGWFAHSASELALAGYTCFAYDRSGSGNSHLPKGHVESYHQWFDELSKVVEYAEAQCPSVPIHLLSLCFGAKIVLGTLALCDGFSRKISSAIFQCPGIKTKVNLGLTNKAKVVLYSKDRTDIRIPTPLKDALFTDEPDYLRFIENDLLALRDATPGFFFETAKLNRQIQACAEKISIPVLFMLAGQDRISNNYKTVRFFQNLPAIRKKIISYRKVKHSIFFSSDREQAIEDIRDWLEEQS